MVEEELQQCGEMNALLWHRGWEAPGVGYHEWTWEWGATKERVRGSTVTSLPQDRMGTDPQVSDRSPLRSDELKDGLSLWLGQP